MPKRIAAIHDLAGIGRCSLTIALPVLSAMGLQCCPMPTAILSSQTDGYTGYSFADMTENMENYIRHWAKLELTFDGIFTGFLGSEKQIDIVREFIIRFQKPGGLTLVDPVMGERGRAYDTYTRDMCRKMEKLVECAQVITPNLTEAALLLNENYDTAPADEDGLYGWAERLSRMGPRMVAITGVSLPGNCIGTVCFDRERSCQLLRTLRAGSDTPGAGDYPGAGDLFASVLLGGLMGGMSLENAAEKAADFVAKCALHSVANAAPVREGLVFEPLIPLLLR